MAILLDGGEKVYPVMALFVKRRPFWRTIDELRQIAHEQVALEPQKRRLYLLAQDNLTADEQAELACG
jgi:hypothetical protein